MGFYYTSAGTILSPTPFQPVKTAGGGLNQRRFLEPKHRTSRDTTAQRHALPRREVEFFFYGGAATFGARRATQQASLPSLTSFYSRFLFLRVPCTQPIAVNSSRQIHAGKAEQSYQADFKSKEKNIY